MRQEATRRYTASRTLKVFLPNSSALTGKEAQGHIVHLWQSQIGNLAFLFPS